MNRVASRPPCLTVGRRVPVPALLLAGLLALMVGLLGPTVTRGGREDPGRRVDGGHHPDDPHSGPERSDGDPGLRLLL